MEDELIHEQCAAYALDALDPDDERAFEAHLATCVRCREELASLTETVTELAHAAPPVDAPDALRGRILAAARAERAKVVPLRSRRPFLVAATLAAVASCAAIGLGVWAATLYGGGNPSLAAVQGIPLRGATGSLLRSANGEAALVVSGLAPAPAGKTYEAWVIRGRKAAPAGLFAARGRTAIVHLTRRVPVGSIVGITLERAGGVPAPTGSPLVTSARA